MKKGFFVFLLALCAAVCLAACGGGKTVSDAGESVSAANAAETAEEDSADTPVSLAGADAPTAEEMYALFLDCTGFQSSAGASLRSAMAAFALVQFAVERDLANVDADALRTAILDGYTRMGDDERAEFDLNFAAYISPLAEGAFTAWNSVKDTFADVELAESMEELAQTPGAFEDWNALRSYVFIMGNEMS